MQRSSLEEYHSTITDGVERVSRMSKTWSVNLRTGTSSQSSRRSWRLKRLSWKILNRLHNRFERLRKRRLHRNKITVAVARELSSFIWDLGQLMPAEGRWPFHMADAETNITTN